VLSQEKGLVIIYTGNGKGKTTAALGLVLRAVGYKKKCLIVQFAKNWFTGELVGIKKLGPSVKIVQGGKGFVGILGDRKPISEHKKAADETFDYLYKEAMGGKWDIIVADEIIGSISSKLLSLPKVVSFLTEKPKNLDIILTGRNAPQKLIKLADLVTEMREIKHPYNSGILAKKGIDF
jgi:cob(I)alamin adenosyltransferase